MKVIFYTTEDKGRFEIPVELFEKLNLVNGAEYAIKQLNDGGLLFIRVPSIDNALAEVNERYAEVLSNLA